MFSIDLAPNGISFGAKINWKSVIQFLFSFNKQDLESNMLWPPIWTPNVKLLINYLCQISAFKWTLVLYFSLCITPFIISRTDNTISVTHGSTLYSFYWLFSPEILCPCDAFWWNYTSYGPSIGKLYFEIVCGPQPDWNIVRETGVSSRHIRGPIEAPS